MRKKHPLSPEPGGWVLDMPRGMPTPKPPAPLDPTQKLTTAKIQEIIDYEGLGYALYHYIPSRNITDKKLARLWEEARLAMQRIVKYTERAAQKRTIKKTKRRVVETEAIDIGEEI